MRYLRSEGNAAALLYECSTHGRWILDGTSDFREYPENDRDSLAVAESVTLPA